MITIKELKEITTESIITAIYYKGIVMSGGKQLKCDEKELQRYCEELARRGVVDDGYKLYVSMCQ